jgi:hypothetical protein
MEQQTCGQGLADHSMVTAKLGELTALTARNLELHMQTLDRDDENSKREYDIYQRLVNQHGEIAERLMKAANEMAGYHDLPMGKHDEEKMKSAKVFDAFENYIKLEQELIAILNDRLVKDQELIAGIDSVHDYKR